MQQHRKRQDLLGNNICSIGEKKKKKPEAFAHSNGRTDGRRTDFSNAICHLPSMCTAAAAPAPAEQAKHVNGQWRDILMESLRKSERVSERRERPFGRTQFGHKIRNQSRRSFTMEKCCVALETASELKFQAKVPGDFPANKIDTFNAALNPISSKTSRV